MLKILVANRGEIAIRVLKTLRKMGIQSIAVYSEADQNALHLKYADEAVCIGPAPSSQSYLNQEKILEVAKKYKVQAIHPGYGFLSENASFARLLKSNGIKLIGPTAEAMEIMGSKLGAKEAVKNFNIPMVPGTETAIEDFEEASKIASSIGFPILIKASAGGGGKGMRIVHKTSEMSEQIQLAMNEAKAAFGDGSVFIEKYIESPKHIEVQILADQFGKTLYLFERECSIQRRHQKVIEEAPGPVITPDLRKRMGEAAVKVAQSCSYEGAGTVEFLLDEQKNFYFLEMNTRLQVEHPVTEMITGLDIVEWQIRIAFGESLPYEQDKLQLNGHSIELRIYAEDPEDNFMPSINILSKYTLPKGDGIRVDNGISEGMMVPIYYDPMLAKLIVHAPNRAAAIKKMKTAIQNYTIEGIANTLNFGAFVMNHPSFISGEFDTHFVQKYWNKEEISKTLHKSAVVASLVSKYILESSKEQITLPKG
ncbi:MAG: acetyl-CoA carboxylase biotin carboxylase subunit [Saprospiraceae bacterium]